MEVSIWLRPLNGSVSLLAFLVLAAAAACSTCTLPGTVQRGGCSLRYQSGICSLGYQRGICSLVSAASDGGRRTWAEQRRFIDLTSSYTSRTYNIKRHLCFQPSHAYTIQAQFLLLDGGKHMVLVTALLPKTHVRVVMRLDAIFHHPEIRSHSATVTGH